MLTSLFAAPSVATATASPAPTRGIAAALVTDGFQAGNIISDANFFNATSMNAPQIDAFLRSKLKTCQSGYTCLKDYRQDTPNRSSDAYCRGYSGAPAESSASIIYKVAQSCGINPQVLLVMLQKEQSLITWTYPDAGRYAAAMGQGCPDTAACDPRYAGFFYQVYYAARQMQIYAEGRWFKYYAPGKTWNILYHHIPQRNCGSAPVYVQNIATSALYYYTPYQPNAASLRAGYGTGDSCSSYGNRNFYNYFKDWFGAPQGPSDGPIMVPGGDKIYLLMGGKKHHITSPEDLAPFEKALHTVTMVSTSFMNALPEGPRVTRYVHDPRTGTLYLLEPDGTKHRFADADQIARFGYDFSSYVNLVGSVADAFQTGQDVQDFFRSGSDPEVYVREGATKRYIATLDTWQSLTGGKATYVASMGANAFAKIPHGPVAAPALTLVRTKAENRVHLVLPQGRLAYIPSFELASEFGAGTYVTVPDGALDANPRASGSLAPVVQCGDVRYLVSNGSLQRIQGADAGGITPLMLTAAECSAFRVSSTTVSAPFFVQPQGRGEVYTIAGARLRYVRTPQDLAGLNGSRPLQLQTWSTGTVAWFGIGAEYVPEGAFLTFQGRGEVYQYSQGVIHHVRSATTLTALGGGRFPPLRTLSSDEISNFVVGSPILTNNSDFVQFRGASEVYQYAGGSLHHIQQFEALLRLGGGSVPPILVLDSKFKADYAMGAPIS